MELEQLRHGADRKQWGPLGEVYSRQGELYGGLPPGVLSEDFEVWQPSFGPKYAGGLPGSIVSDAADPMGFGDADWRDDGFFSRGLGLYRDERGLPTPGLEYGLPGIPPTYLDFAPGEPAGRTIPGDGFTTGRVVPAREHRDWGEMLRGFYRWQNQLMPTRSARQRKSHPRSGTSLRR